MDSGERRGPLARERPGNASHLLSVPGEELPDLATVIDAWTSLPDAIRAGIVAMVKAAN